VGQSRDRVAACPASRPATILVAIMPTHTFDLLFAWNPKDKLAPLDASDASAQIVMKSDLTIYSRDERIAVSTECANLHELEEWIAFLHGELDQVLTTGRRKFAERDRFGLSA